MNRCPHCNKTIGYMPERDVNNKKLKLPDCPYRKGKRNRAEA